MSRQNMSEDEMRAFSNRVLPHLKQISKIADESGVEPGIMMWVTDNYISISGSGLCGWELSIYGGKPEMKFEKKVSLIEPIATCEKCGKEVHE